METKHQIEEPRQTVSPRYRTIVISISAMSMMTKIQEIKWVEKAWIAMVTVCDTKRAINKDF